MVEQEVNQKHGNGKSIHEGKQVLLASLFTSLLNSPTFKHRFQNRKNVWKWRGNGASVDHENEKLWKISAADKAKKIHPIFTSLI